MCLASSGKTTERVGGWRQYKTDPAQKDEFNCPTTIVSYDFFETMKASMATDDHFQKNIPPTLLNAYVINESAAKFLGIDDPVGKDLMGTTFTGSQWFRRNAIIIGVVKDFHYASLHDKVQPIVFCLASEQTENLGWMEVRINSENMPKTMTAIEETWKTVANDRPFSFRNLWMTPLPHTTRLKTDSWKIFTTFSVLSIMLGGLGLFGLQRSWQERGQKRSV
ncbi:MAG: hypothetical protein WDO15_25500 [Bacteroidota bacterium]